MADFDDKISIGADLGNTKQQMDKLKSLFEDAATGMDRFLSATTKMNADGKTLEATFVGITKSFEEVVKVISIGPRGGSLQGLKSLTDASGDLATGFNVLKAITDKFSQQLGTLDNSVKSVQKSISDAASSQIQAVKDADAAEADLARKRKDRARDAKRDVESSVAANLGSVGGKGASQTELVNFQNAQKRVIQSVLDSTRFPAGRQASLDEAFSNARTGAIATTGPTVQLEQAVLSLVTAYERLGKSAKDANDKAIAAAKQQQQQVQQQQQQTQNQQRIQLSRGLDADTIGNVLRNQFQAPPGVTEANAARLEIPIKRFQELALQGRLEVEQLTQAVKDFGSSGTLNFNNLSARSASLLRQLVATRDALIKQSLEVAKQNQFSKTQSARDLDADTTGLVLRSVFTAPAGASQADAARLEIPIKRFQELAAQGKLEVNELNKAVIDFVATGSVNFDTLSAKTAALLRQLIAIDEKFKQQAAKPTLSPIADRTKIAQDTVTDLQNVFAAPIAATGGSTDKVNKLIADLGLLVIKADLSKARLLDLFNAAGSQGGAASILPGLTKDENRVINLIQQIATLRNTAVDKFTDSAAKAQLLNNTLKQAGIIIPTIIDGFGKLRPEQFAAVQGAVNRLFDAVKKGQLDLNKLSDAADTLQSHKAGPNKPPTDLVFLPPDAGGKEQQALLQIQNLFKEVDKTGTNAGNNILLTWRNVIRIFEVQVLHTAIGQFINDLRTSVDSARQFQIRISEIRTLSQENQLSTEQWAKGLRNLSDSFGIPLLDVTKAAYDAISNQVTRGAQTFEFLRTTLNFALVTVSSATDAQNLLSSAVKSFGEKNLTAQKAAESLFKLIDLGRVTTGEIANIFGRVGQLAGQAGLNIDELGAALATLTVQGVKPDEAFTLLNNLLLKLVKTTPEMTQLLLKLGFASGEAALRGLGLGGVFRLLNKELESGGLDRIGELEGNIRAIRAAVAVSSGDPLAEFEKNLEGFKNSAQSFSEATNIIRESAGRNLTVQLNEIKNIFTADFGQQFIQTILNLSEPFGGLANLTKSVVEIFRDLLEIIARLLRPVIELSVAILNIIPGGTVNSIKLLVEAFTAFVVAQGLAKPVISAVTVLMNLQLSSVQALITSLKGLITTTNIATLGLAAAVFAYLEYRQSADEATESIKRQTETLKQNREEAARNTIQRQQQSGIDDFAKKNEAPFRNALNLIAAQTRESVKLLDNLHEINTVGVKGLEESLRKTFKEFDKKLTPFEQLKNILNEIDKSEKRVLAINIAEQNKAFENSLLGLIDTQQFDKILNQVKVLKQNIANILNDPINAKIISAESLDAVRKTFDDITKILDKYNNQLLTAIKSQEKLIADLKVKGETKAFEDSLIGKSPEQQTKLTFDRVEQLRKQAFDLFNTGNLEESSKKFDEIDRLLGKITEKQKSFRDRAGKLGFEFQQPVAADELARRNEADRLQLAQQRLQQLKDLEAQTAEQRRIAAQQAIENEEKFKQAELKRIADAVAAEQQLTEKKKQQVALEQQRKNLESQNNDAVKRRAEVQSKLLDLQKDFEKGFSDPLKKLGQNLGVENFSQGPETQQALQNQFGNLTQNFNQQNVEQFLSQLAKTKIFLDQINHQKNAGIFGGQTQAEIDGQKQIDDFYQAQLLKVKQLVEAKKQQAQAEADIAAAQAGQRKVVDELNKLQKAPPIPGQEIPTAINDFSTKLDTTLNLLIQSINDLATSIKGPVPRFAGGGPLGTDTHLFWGNPNEFIVNAQSSQRFAPQLRAINMGFEPKFNSNSTSNAINVGDIHVTVQGGQTNTATAREIGNQMRREIRRGTLRQ